MWRNQTQAALAAAERSEPMSVSNYVLFTTGITIIHRPFQLHLATLHLEAYYSKPPPRSLIWVVILLRQSSSFVG